MTAFHFQLVENLTFNVTKLRMKNDKNGVFIGKKDAERIRKYLVDTSKYIPEKVRATVRWQNTTTKIISSLEVN